jgi:hypothetical protein
VLTWVELGREAPAADHELFEFRVGRCLITRTTGHGDPAPQKLVRRAR